LDQLLDTPGLDTGFRRNLIVATQRLSTKSALYPTCYELKNVVLESQHPVAAGSFADIYKANFQGQSVCLKAMRIYQNTEVEYFLKVDVSVILKHTVLILIFIAASVEGSHTLGTVISSQCPSDIRTIPFPKSNLPSFSMDGIR
jgi:hypothetical protein